MPDWNSCGSYRNIKENSYPGYIETKDGKCLSDLIKVACDYPEYAKIEIDTDSATDLRCPYCGSTHVFFKGGGYIEEDDGVRNYYSTVGVICASCGFERELGEFCAY